MSEIKIFFSGVLTGIILTLLAVGAYQYRANLMPAIPGFPSNAIIGQHTETVPINRIQAYSSDTKRTLHLPADVLKNAEDHVVASTTARGNIHPQTVTAVTDTQTGITQLYVKQEPLPWFSKQRSGEVSISTGFHGSQRVTQLEVSEDLAQIKMLRFGVTGRLESDGKVFAGLRVSAGW